MASMAGREKKTKGRRKTKNKSIDAGNGKMSAWEQQRERQKLFQKLKIEKELLEKDKKKARSDRAEVEKKRQQYLKEKAVNDRLAMKYQCEKELWLERKKKKGHNFNKQFLINKVASKIKEWEKKTEDAKEEWMNIEEDKVEIKELEVGLGRDQEQLKIDQADLVRQKMEFEVKSKDMEEVSITNVDEKERLKVLEDPLIEEEKKLDERIQKYDAYDSLVTGREEVAGQKESEQNCEGLRLENIKQRLLALLEKRKVDFNDRSIQLYEQITSMDESFAELFHDIAEKEENVVAGGNDPSTVTEDQATEA